METHRGRVGPVSSFTNKIDGMQYIVSTIPSRSRGLRIGRKEQLLFDPKNELWEGFQQEFEFDVVFQTCVYKLQPRRKKLFFVNYTDFTMTIQEFHKLISNLLMKAPIEEMFGASCSEKYEEIGFAAVPAKMGLWGKKQHVFLITRPSEAS